MTPSGTETPPASFDAILDSVASLPSGATDTQSTEPSTEVDDAVVDTPALDEVEPVEAEAAAEAEAAPAVVEPTTQPEIEEGVRPWGKDYHVTKPRMEKFIAANKFQQGIQPFAPTVEDAHHHYLKANDWYEMHSDFADPEQLDNWMTYWQGQNPQSFAEIARRIPERVQGKSPEVYTELQQKFISNLKTENPKLYGDIANRAVQERIDSLYEQWASLDPKSTEAEQARFKAQQADFMLNGSYRTEVTRIDPVERQRQQQEALLKKQQDELTNRQRAIDERENNGRVQYWTRTEQRINQDKANQLQQEINVALQPVEKSFTKDQLDAFKDRINNIVTKRMTEDFEWSRNRQLDMAGMKRNTLQALQANKSLTLTPAVKAYLDSHVAYARPIIAEAARALIGQTTARIVKDNKDVHQRLASGQKPGANGNRPATAPFPAARPGNKQPTFNELFDSIGAKK